MGKRHDNFTITVILEPFARCIAKEAVAFWLRQRSQCLRNARTGVKNGTFPLLLGHFGVESVEIVTLVGEKTAQSAIVPATPGNTQEKFVFGVAKRLCLRNVVHNNGKNAEFSNLTRVTSDDSRRLAERFVACCPFPSANGGDFENISRGSKLDNLHLRKGFVFDIVDETFTKLEARHG